MSTVRSDPIRLLVVDDDPMVRKLVTRALAQLEPDEIVEVSDGREAQRVLTEEHIDVVITDVMMPNMDGRQLMRWAKEHCPGPLWIVLSGLDTFDAAIEALHLGAFDYLPKPPEVQLVKVSMRNALDQIALVRERESLQEMLEERVEQLAGLCRMLEDQAEVIDADLARAELIQRSLLPQVPPRLDGWSIETLYRPGTRVGGDFYDITVLNVHYVGIVIADAAGHGVAAAMLSVLFKHGLDLRGSEGVRMPAEVLRLANKHLNADISAPGTFITAVYALVDRFSGQVRIASAGHPPCVTTSASADSPLVVRTGPALGLQDDPVYEETTVDLEQGERLFLYTDGALQGSNQKPQDLVANLNDTKAERNAVLKNLYAEAIDDNDEDRDDITMVLLERGDGGSHFDTTMSSARQPPVAVAAPPQLAVGVSDGHAYVSILGRAAWMRSTLFFETSNRLITQHGQLTIDLGQCEYLDSTFLGTLYEVVNANAPVVKLQNVPRHLRDMFEEFSMDAVIVHISADTEPLPDDMEPVARVDDPDRHGKRMRRAHEVLASLSDENREQFRGVLEAFVSDEGEG